MVITIYVHPTFFGFTSVFILNNHFMVTQVVFIWMSTEIAIKM